MTSCTAFDEDDGHRLHDDEEHEDERIRTTSMGSSTGFRSTQHASRRGISSTTTLPSTVHHVVTQRSGFIRHQGSPHDGCGRCTAGQQDGIERYDDAHVMLLHARVLFRFWTPPHAVATDCFVVLHVVVAILSSVR